MVRFVLAVLLLVPALPASAGNKPPSPVPLRIDPHGAIVLDVVVNGEGPYRFMLDTGTSRSIVSSTLARELRAPVVAKSDVVTNGGTETRLVVSLESLSVAAARVGRVLAPVLPDAALAEIGPDVRGVLGQDFLSEFNYTLDYRRGRLTWDGPLACGGPDAVPLVAAEGRFVMAVEGERGAPLRLVPDSGTDAPILFHAAPPREAASTLPLLRIGAVRLTDVAAYNVQRTDPNADGLLPLHRFAAVSFAAGGSCLVARE